jgi:L-ascorbate metabolism protein UlaG (beta-lactamase superfamily)
VGSRRDFLSGGTKTMKVTYIRWSMTIIETNGLTIITDPVILKKGF